MLKLYILLLIIIQATAINIKTCNNTKPVTQCYTKLQDFPGLHLDGCLGNSSEIEKVSSVLSCGRKFLSQNSNISYIFSGANQSCYSCEASTAKGIVFNTSSYLFLPRKTVLQNVTSSAYIFVNGLPTGSVVHLEIPYQANDKITFFFFVNATTYNLQLNTEVHSTGRLLVGLSIKVNSVWGSQSREVILDTYVINRPISHYIFVRGDKFLVYVDGKFCCDFNHVIPTSLMTKLTLYPTMRVITFSV